MNKIDYSKLKATPEKENFSGKYENTNFISKFLVNNYFKSVKKLIHQINNQVDTAHEIGCGEGLSTIRLNQMIPKLTASEYVNDLVLIANPSITIFQENVYDLKLDDNSTDLIFLLEVLEHLDYPYLALEEIKRVTKKYLIIGVPREPLWCLLNMSRLKYLKNFGNTPGHLNHWSKKNIIKIVEEKFGKVIAVQSPIPWTIILAEKNN